MKKLTYVFIILSLCLCALMLSSCEKTYEITYELDGGVNSADAPTKCKESGTVTLEFPERENYMFLGWYTEPTFENRIDSVTEPKNDITVYAKWISHDEAFLFVEAEGGYRLESCLSREHTIIIPEKHNGLPVVEIGEKAFATPGTIKHLYISSSVEIIETYQDLKRGFFYNPSHTLEEVTVDEENPLYKSVDGIMYSKDGKTLVCYPSGRKDTEFSVPEEVIAIGDKAFCRNFNLEKVILANNIKSIGTNAFAWCNKLKDIELPEGITTIGSGAFYQCTALEVIEIPDMVTEIGSHAFGYCINLKKITLSKNLEKIDRHLFKSCFALRNITIPEGVTSIGDYAFHYCSGLKYISLPSTLKSIDKNAFDHCDTIANITIPEGVISIGERAFRFCDELESITLPSTLESLGKEAFFRCESLPEVDLPDSLISIGSAAFSGCYNMNKLDIPNNVTSPLLDIIKNFKNLHELKIGAGVSEIDPECFDFLRSSLEKVTVDEGNKYFKSVDGVLFSKDSKTLILYPLWKHGTSYTIPDGVTVIGRAAFYGCINLTSINIPSNVTEIGEGVFCNSQNLVVYCEVESKPDSWDDEWAQNVKEVIWGYKGN